MAVGMVTALRNARLDAITTFVGSAGKLRIYSGTRPATGGATTTLLAELTLGSPMAGAASGGVLSFNAITGDTSADATGTASWARVFKSDGTTICFDCSVGTSSADIILNTTSLVAGAAVNITSSSITEGNA